jgi:cytochrome c oxidase assembly factor 1
MLVATNQEKLSSSVFRSVLRALRADAQLQDVLGDAIRPQAEWYLNGDPLINGYV